MANRTSIFTRIYYLSPDGTNTCSPCADGGTESDPSTYVGSLKLIFEDLLANNIHKYLEANITIFLIKGSSNEY